MFTGIVEEVGKVAAIEKLDDSVRIKITANTVISDVHLGDSIAVNGVCLTVTSFGDAFFTADVMQESLNRSSLGSLEKGSSVNLERALLAQSRLGGHIMQGHVDGTTTLLSRTHSQHWDVLRFKLPSHLARYVVEKGSIALSGTSLTVSSVGENWFEVSLIPATLLHTTHGELKIGDEVNIEVDILGKYVEKMLSTRTQVE
ncbi:riboflavin synthase subunit alpha [Corynebacterium kutscheri]|uniref:Riboflavin synthase n=1 Tax=Corynebacterium kutscheri TaxID=35755 RepID=A0A0F6QZQ0_9CORY|nr:riboflavin synthase [Corynebacterium kutscheri]AKE41292.1 riboflavin synthase alpha chain [Corynebacterium kutscheri]VEH08568.1 riboflavin synthase subunit alpha [Corynebacterium kutscheri]VEH09614.1 riboflavin synthase subunit alpha [Corynebacterium kutscheri]VEH79697.1 riboflavin synthase subunit alpha [Corynebacterium kutscheri]